MSLQIVLNSNLDKPLSQYLLKQYGVYIAATMLKERSVPVWIAARLLNPIRRANHARR